MLRKSFGKATAYLCAGLLLFNAAFCSFIPGSSVKASSDLSSSYNWKPVKIGGGGLVTGVIVHPKVDNLVYCRTDVGGAYKWNSTKLEWEQLITSKSVPLEVINAEDPNKGEGVIRSGTYKIESIAIDPSDPNILYVAGGDSASKPGVLLKSTNQGASFELTGLSVPMEGNGNCRTDGERISVDPNNSNIVYYGSRSQGLWRSTDGGINWSQISTSIIPEGIKVGSNTVGINEIIFDVSSGVDAANMTKRIYTPVAGVGIYMSEDGGSTWSSIYSLTSKYALEMQVVQGTLFASILNSGMKKYIPGLRWSDISPNNSIKTFTVDYHDSNRIYACTAGFKQFYRSTDGGSTWTLLGTHTSSVEAREYFNSDNIPWVKNSTVRSWLSPGQILLDPRKSGVIWFSEGMGMWRSTNISDTQNTPTFYNISMGIEEMISNDIQVAGNGNVITNTWDRVGFLHTDVDQFPNAQIGLTDDFTDGNSIESAPGNPNFLVQAIADHRLTLGDKNFSGYSTDGGNTWTRFSSISGDSNNPKVLKFGEIAVSAGNTDKMVWLPRNGPNAVYYTTDCGSSWNQGIISGYSNNNQYYFENKRALASDESIEGRFYLYSWNPGTIFRSDDSGATWTQTSATLPNYAYHGQMRSAPGRSGHLWFATGFDYRPSTAGGLHFSSNGGDSFTKITGVEQCWAVGFGKAETAEGHPTIFIHGKVNGQWGVFRSTDQGVTWDYLVDYPLGLFNKVNAITGDPNIFGRVYVAINGNSFVYGDLKTGTPSPTPTLTPTPTIAPTLTPTPIPSGTILESGIYRARQVGERVHIERSLTAGRGDYDADGDGWALVGRTNGAGENGELIAFYVQDGTPYAVLKAYTVQLGWHFRLITPPYLSTVEKGQTRITPVLQQFNLDAAVPLEQGLRQQLKIDAGVNLIINPRYIFQPTPTPTPTPKSVTVSVYSTADSTVMSSTPDKNYGSSPSVDCYTNNANALKNGYFKFDLSEIPGQITGAMLSVFCWNVGSPNEVTVIHLEDDNWTENGITWSNRPTSGTTLTTSWNILKNQINSLDVTEAVQGEMSGNKTISFQVYDNGKWLQLYGKEKGDSFRPELVVTYIP